MTLYRIQDNEGCGPYRPGFSMVWTRRIRSVERYMPWPLEFPEITYEMLDGFHVGCACSSTKVLKEWFSKKEFKILFKYNYRCTIFEPDIVFAQSDKQVLFGMYEPLKNITKFLRLY